jgi:hypothetical protein
MLLGMHDFCYNLTVTATDVYAKIICHCLEPIKYSNTCYKGAQFSGDNVSGRKLTDSFLTGQFSVLIVFW